MSSKSSDKGDYQSLKSSGNGGRSSVDKGVQSLRRSKSEDKEKNDTAALRNFGKPAVEDHSEKDSKDLTPKPQSPAVDAETLSTPADPGLDSVQHEQPSNDDALGGFAQGLLEEKKQERLKKQGKKDFKMLTQDNWVKRNGHYLTYVGLYIFSILVLFRPYELIPELGFLGATAFYVAAGTIAIFIPVQLSAEGTITYLSFEVKMVILFVAIALLSIPIAKSPRTAWAEFNDVFIKAVLMFIVMVNVLRTRKRLMGMIWLSLGIAVVLSVIALRMYLSGELGVEGYRVGVSIGGMFGNPNDLALHLVMMIPLAIVFGMATHNGVKRVVFLGIAALLSAGVMVTYSRGGFLGLACVGAFLIWKLGKQNRLQVMAIAAVFGVFFILFAPGNYGLRLLSIFLPGLDEVGSSDQRRVLLEQSIKVTLRNPWGIGIGNFPIVGIRNLVTHNSYTQVSTELGFFGLIVYLLFLLSPFRRLAAIERRLENEKKSNWYYYTAIGLQASLIGYCVSSFFVSVAYGWFIYYLVAYAVAFRRIYMIEHKVE